LNGNETPKKDKGTDEADDDDFGFEEYRNVKLIKVPLKEEEPKKETDL
jgi:hypothetical protein